MYWSLHTSLRNTGHADIAPLTCRVFDPGKSVPVPTSLVPVLILMLRRCVNFTRRKGTKFVWSANPKPSQDSNEALFNNFIEKSSS